ncbi:MAG: hypothetical protein U9N81_12400 [Bacillota bacterium]|nr:hypothetical protein [Bacillota bacterium]
MNRSREIQINLLNYKFEKQIARKRIIFEISIYCLIGVLIVGGLFFSTLSKRAQIADLQSANELLAVELQQSNAQTGSLVSKEKIVEQIKAREDLISNVESKQSNFAVVFEEIGKMSVPGILLIDIDVNDGNVVLNGLAASRSGMVSFLKWIKETFFAGEISDLKYDVNEETGELSFQLLVNLEVSEK